MATGPSFFGTSLLKWVLMVLGCVFILFLTTVVSDLSKNGFLDARNANFPMDERTYPSPDGTKAVKLTVFRSEPRYTGMMLDHGRSGCGIFHYPDTGLMLMVRWTDNEHVQILGPDSLRSGLNPVNDTCQFLRSTAYVSFEAR
jgi:hypothetical protein